MVEGPRACQESEFEEVIALINQVFRVGTNQDIRTDYPLVFNHSKMEYMRILKVDGKVVAHVPVWLREAIIGEDRLRIGIISPTVTHPDYRRHGYATHCLRDCIRIMDEEGVPVSVLWTLETTFPFYQQSGWEAVGSQGWLYQLRPQECALFESGAFDVVQYDPSNTDSFNAMMKLHDTEPHRIGRSIEEYRALFSLPQTTTFLAMSDEKVAAYLIFGEGVNKPGLIEGGGETAGLETLVRHVMLEREADSEIQVLLPLVPSSLGELIEEKKPGSGRPIEEAKGVGYQMIRVNSLEKLLKQIENHIQSKSTRLRGEVCFVCRETDEAVTLKFHEGEVDLSTERLAEAVVLTRRQLTQLIFGAHPAAKPVKYSGVTGEILNTIFPFYVPIWELDHS
ncbi:GNAT family N-acetyltransferase [Candidatus Poribacteria bacterium]|nr:GNAT family N-acetyltransferase [Candidatus Poribacteria bacterium]